MLSYEDFLRAKIKLAATDQTAIAVDVHPFLKPHQQAAVRWAVAGGRRAIFAAFGLGKTVMQIEAVRQVLGLHGGMGLIVAPLGVRHEFINQGRSSLGTDIRFIRSVNECSGPGIYITNYETVRDGKLDPAAFTVTTLDEADILRGFGGSKTFREFMRLFEAVQFRFVATATPSPNEYIELLAYAAYLGIMDVGEAKTRFFKRNSEKADQLTLHPHKEREFWLWVSSWALFIQRPSDLGFSDEGYALPPLHVEWHEVQSSLIGGEPDRSGQMELIRSPIIGVQGAAKEKRETLASRVAKARELVDASSPSDHWILWHDLESERAAIEVAFPDAVSVYGTQSLDEREELIVGFQDGRHRILATKPILAGAGCNFQRHCHKAIFVGVGFKFRDLIQAVHRIYRFLQSEQVEIHIIHSENEREIVRLLRRRWSQHNEQAARMSAIIREYGLSEQAMAKALERSLGCERVEVSGDTYRLINNDTVIETRSMPESSVGLIVTSIPFSTQYEYSPSYNDFGHTDDDGHFWQQMGYLIPEMLRVLKPGRLAAVHVKDRIIPGGINGLGFQTLSTFHMDCVREFKRHGFAYMGMKTITTDVVRENNQTYRLGWSEQCKDATKISFGVPEYLLLFRRPQSDTMRSYADEPVVKDKGWWVDPEDDRPGYWQNPEGYSRARWQMDAAGYTRSSGNRPPLPEEIMAALTHPDHEIGSQIAYRAWKKWNLQQVYDFEHHVKIAEAFEERGRLPSTFCLLPVHSPHPDVWTDITRMRTANTLQSQSGNEQHLCPMQFDIADRAIKQWSNPGEVVFDPFGGLMTVPMRAVKWGRIGWGVELNGRYFLDGCAYVKAEAHKVAVPTLFDLLDPSSLVDEEAS